MTTIILADSRFKDLKQDNEFSDCILHIRSGSRIQDHVSFVKRHERKHSAANKLYVVLLGINNIRDDIKDLDAETLDAHKETVQRNFRTLIRAIKSKNKRNVYVIGTIAPKDLLRSISKYPRKSELLLKNITSEHQKKYEDFVVEVNKDVNDLNNNGSGAHLALHTDLRIHRGSGATRRATPKSRTSRFFYDKLRDGLHPGKELLDIWKRKILDVKYQLSL